MAYMIYCVDKPGCRNLRAETREAHLAHIAKYKDKLILVGPMLTEDRSAMIGSLLIVDMESREEVEAMVEADPYSKVSLFETVIIRPFKKVLP